MYANVPFFCQGVATDNCSLNNLDIPGGNYKTCEMFITYVTYWHAAQDFCILLHFFQNGSGVGGKIKNIT